MVFLQSRCVVAQSRWAEARSWCLPSTGPQHAARWRDAHYLGRLSGLVVYNCPLAALLLLPFACPPAQPASRRTISCCFGIGSPRQAAAEPTYHTAITNSKMGKGSSGDPRVQVISDAIRVIPNFPKVRLRSLHLQNDMWRQTQRAAVYICQQARPPTVACTPSRRPPHRALHSAAPVL